MTDINKLKQKFKNVWKTQNRMFLQEKSLCYLAYLYVQTGAKDDEIVL